MTTVRSAAVIAALCAATLVQGCASAVAFTVYRAEQARLEKLDTWERSLQTLDCEQLAVIRDNLDYDREDLVDYDQRVDIVDALRADKPCELS